MSGKLWKKSGNFSSYNCYEPGEVKLQIKWEFTQNQPLLRQANLLTWIWNEQNRLRKHKLDIFFPTVKGSKHNGMQYWRLRKYKHFKSAAVWGWQKNVVKNLPGYQNQSFWFDKWNQKKLGTFSRAASDLWYPCSWHAYL